MPILWAEKIRSFLARPGPTIFFQMIIYIGEQIFFSLIKVVKYKSNNDFKFIATENRILQYSKVN